MNRRAALAASGTLAATAAAAATWEATRRRDRRRIEADPWHARLHAPEGGRRQTVRARDGTALHAEVFGPDGAPTIVLTHGWTCAIRFWTLQIDELQRNFRVVAWDLRGHGESERPASGDWSIETFGDDLGAVLEATVPDGEKAIVAGHSLGGMTIVSWADRHREQVDDRVAAAALVCTGMGDLITESLLVRNLGALDPVTRRVGAVALSMKTPMPKDSTPISHRLIRHAALSPAASPAQVAFCEDLVLSCRREVRGGVGASLSRVELHDAVEHLAVPTLVLAAEGDRLTPPPHARRLAETLPHVVDHVEVPRHGHMLPIENPDEVTPRLRRLAEDHLARPATDAAEHPSSPAAAG